MSNKTKNAITCATICAFLTVFGYVFVFQGAETTPLQRGIWGLWSLIITAFSCAITAGETKN